MTHSTKIFVGLILGIGMLLGAYSFARFFGTTTMTWVNTGTGNWNVAAN